MGFNVLFCPHAPLNVVFSVALYLLSVIHAVCHCVSHTAVKDDMECVMVGLLSINLTQEIGYEM